MFATSRPTNLNPSVEEGGGHISVDVPLGGKFHKIEQLAWLLDVLEANEADLYVCMWAIVVKLITVCASKSGIDKPQQACLHHSLRTNNNSISLVAHIIVASTTQGNKDTDDHSADPSLVAEAIHMISALAVGCLEPSVAEAR